MPARLFGTALLTCTAFLTAAALLPAQAVPAAAADRIASERVTEVLRPVTQAHAEKLEYESLTLPGARDGWLFMIWRRPTLFLDNTRDESRLTLAMHWNGIDDGAWTYGRVLALLLKGICGHGGGAADPQAAATLMRREGRAVEPPRELGGNGGTWRHTLHTGRAGRCRVEKRRKGGRWHTLSITMSLAG